MLVLLLLLLLLFVVPDGVGVVGVVLLLLLLLLWFGVLGKVAKLFLGGGGGGDEEAILKFKDLRQGLRLCSEDAELSAEFGVDRDLRLAEVAGFLNRVTEAPPRSRVSINWTATWSTTVLLCNFRLPLIN